MLAGVFFLIHILFLRSQQTARILPYQHRNTLDIGLTALCPRLNKTESDGWPGGPVGLPGYAAKPPSHNPPTHPPTQHHPRCCKSNLLGSLWGPVPPPHPDSKSHVKIGWPRPAGRISWSRMMQLAKCNNASSVPPLRGPWRRRRQAFQVMPAPLPLRHVSALSSLSTSIFLQTFPCPQKTNKIDGTPPPPTEVGYRRPAALF